VRDYVWPLCNDISQLKYITGKYSYALRAMQCSYEIRFLQISRCWTKASSSIFL